MVAVLAATGCSCGSTDGDGGHDNLPPRAVLIAPVETGTGMLATLDATPSSDEDGLLTGYLFTFGDGSPSEHTGGSVVRHRYLEAGLHQVALTVQDDDGAEAFVGLEVRVVDGLAAPACSPDLACPAGTACMCLHDDDCAGSACGGNRCSGGSGMCYQQAENEAPDGI